MTILQSTLSRLHKYDNPPKYVRKSTRHMFLSEDRKFLVQKHVERLKKNTKIGCQPRRVFCVRNTLYVRVLLSTVLDGNVYRRSLPADTMRSFTRFITGL